jgi:hypothetical protein
MTPHCAFRLHLQHLKWVGALTGLTLCCSSVLAQAATAQSLTSAPGPQFPTSLEGLTPGQTVAQQNGQQTIRQSQALAQDGGYSVNPAVREEVRLFYKTVFGSSTDVSAGWTGDLGSCNAGDTTALYKAATVRRINWFRAMAGVPAAVQLDAGFNAKAQQAALLMSANRQLSHTPPTSWTCFNATGFEAAGKSNLSLGNAGSEAVTNGYMRDPGANNNVVGHRRWVLYPQTQFMGTGDVSGSSSALSSNALWVQDNNIFTTRPAVRDDFVAWPAKGYAPYTAVYPRWSFSYPNADFTSATVSMKENGVAIATRLETVTNGYGENTLVWFPGAYLDGMSWAKPLADTEYQVTVANVRIGGQTRSFSYSTLVFDPDQDAPGNTALTISGASNAAHGQAANFTFGNVAGATAYQWRSMAVQPLVFDDGAEAGSANFTSTLSAGYSLVTTDARATGSSSFHLAHTVATDQVFQLKSTLVGTSGAVLRFASRLGNSTTSQRALVEASTDEGKNWTTLYEQAGKQSNGSGSPETTFTTRQVSLATLADRSFLLRFRYAFANGSFFPQSSSGSGWYVDDIHIEGADVVTTVGTPEPASGNAFSLVPQQTGNLLLQVRPGMYGYFSDWSALKRVSVSATQTVDARDCVMNWAEKTFPTLFAPASVSQTASPYYFRFYSGTSSYLGFSLANDHLYYVAAGNVLDGGPKGQWVATAGCQ